MLPASFLWSRFGGWGDTALTPRPRCSGRRHQPRRSSLQGWSAHAPRSLRRAAGATLAAAGGMSRPGGPSLLRGAACSVGPAPAAEMRIRRRWAPLVAGRRAIGSRVGGHWRRAVSEPAVGDERQLPNDSTEGKYALHCRRTGNDDEIDVVGRRVSSKLDHDVDAAGIDEAHAGEIEHDTARAARQDASDRGPCCLACRQIPFAVELDDARGPLLSHHDPQLHGTDWSLMSVRGHGGHSSTRMIRCRGGSVQTERISRRPPSYALPQFPGL